MKSAEWEIKVFVAVWMKSMFREDGPADWFDLITQELLKKSEGFTGWLRQVWHDGRYLFRAWYIVADIRCHDHDEKWHQTRATYHGIYEIPAVKMESSTSCILIYSSSYWALSLDNNDTRMSLQSFTPYVARSQRSSIMPGLREMLR